MFAEVVLSDDGIIEFEQWVHDSSLAAVEGGVTRLYHRVPSVHGVCRLKPPIVESGNGGVVTSSVVEQGRHDFWVHEGHVAGEDDGDVVVTGRESGSDSGHRSGIRVRIDGKAERSRIAFHRVADGGSLVLSAVED